MAARWGTACNMENFSTANFDEALENGVYSLQHHDVDARDALETFYDCIDSSILSIFEGSQPGEDKTDIDEENEATLLTALADVLDSVEDENLSPFDTLPDVDLLQGQKGNERLATLDSAPLGSLENGDGEEGSRAVIETLDASSLNDLDLGLPIFLEQNGESMSITLNDLVKHMHPYSMSLCLEGEEQPLPEGGILLEVVDKGEHGEPILAIPHLRHSVSMPSEEHVEVEQRALENVSGQAKLKPKKILPEITLSSKILPVEDVREKNVVGKQAKIESSEKCPSKKKKKKKKDSHFERVLQSYSSKKESIKKPQEEQKRKKRVTFAPVLTVAEPELGKVESLLQIETTETQASKEGPFSNLRATTLAKQGPFSNIPATTSTNHAPASPASAEAVVSKPLPVPEESPTPATLPIEKSKDNEGSSKKEIAVCRLSEAKPKSLSLQQYRQFRQQKKPSPLEQTVNSTKWPTLSEAPKELLPISCLPDSNPRDPRHAALTPIKIEPATETMPAWQPKGLAAPPTPEALLVPPASMLAFPRKPLPTKSVPLPPYKPSETLATSVSPAVLSNLQKLPVPVDVQDKKTAAGITVSLPVATTNEAHHSLHSITQAKCLQNTTLIFDVINPLVVPYNIQDISKTQDVKITARITTNVQTSEHVPIKPSTAVPLKKVVENTLRVPVSETAKSTVVINTTRPLEDSQNHITSKAVLPLTSTPMQARIVKLAEQMRMGSAPVPNAMSATKELIESCTSEIGIVATDLTSLLKQFEETQPKVKQSVPAVCGREATAGYSSVEHQTETSVPKTACSPDLVSTAGLTPPATPPHQMWKPLAPVTLLGKQKISEVPKPALNKAIQIEPQPLPSSKLHSKPLAAITHGQTLPFSLDHDYCLVLKEHSQNELGNRWNVKQQPSIVIKRFNLPSNKKAPEQSGTKLTSTSTTAEDHDKILKDYQHTKAKKEPFANTVMVTPDASPDRWDCVFPMEDESSNECQKFQTYREHSPCPYNHKRGRSQRTYRTQFCSILGSRSSSSESSRSRSRSCSPPRKRYRSGSRSSSRDHSHSLSRSLSPSRHRRYSYSSSFFGSRSLSHSRSRSRSHSPTQLPCIRNARHSPNQRSSYVYDSRSHNDEMRSCKEKAIEERRVVYVGRIHGSMTRKELKRRFSFFGEIEECTVHFREQGDNYGFVTYYNTKDAFNAIENGSKLRQPNELPFDLCFGGRRQFCRTGYADLDSNQDFDPVPAKGKFDALDFDTLLKQAQRNLKR